MADVNARDSRREGHLPTMMDFGLDGIAHQLEDRALAVPVYQRSYSWREPQVKDFWSDLKAAFDNDQQEYFLGTIVLSKEGMPDRDTIIDGQQRLATTAILLAAIRDEYRHRNDDRRAAIIHNTYLARADLTTGADVPRLQLNSEDDEFFRQLVINSADPAPVSQRDSHRLIADGLRAFRAAIAATADDAGLQWHKRLADWTKFLATRVRLIYVEVATEADAFLIFETLNDRGADLTIADLLKNYLFGRARDRLDVVRDGWRLALGALDIGSENALFTTFLRHYWSSVHGATRERELYKSIKERVTNETQAVDLVQELQRAARLYSALLNSDHDVWSSLGTGTRSNVETVLRLDLEQNRPLLLAALQHFSPPEIRKLLRAIVAWSVRGLVVGGIGGGTTERRYCDAAVSIRKGDIKIIDQLYSALSSIIPTDEEFRAAFSTIRVPRGAQARYYLCVLEGVERGDSEPELVPNRDEEKVNLEHVLPKSVNRDDWPGFTADQSKDLVDRLGNMVLMSKGPNSRIGNKPFALKKPILSGSKLQLTRSVGESPDWTPSDIADRQAKLADLAVAAWPRAPR
jgi:hypothetical protein